VTKFQYHDKRDDHGSLLRYSGDELAYEVANNALRIIFWSSPFPTNILTYTMRKWSTQTSYPLPTN
jgi:hypothetical protein